MHEDFHETLFARWVLDAHERGLRLDFHLPICDRDHKDMKQVLATYVRLHQEDKDLTNLPRPGLKDESSKWKCFSYMQKGIRRGEFVHAWRAAYALLSGGKTADAMWRRLAVTALEDVGLADPYAVAFTLLVGCDKKLREQIGVEQTLAFCLWALCSAPKSRDLCDAVVYNFLPHTMIKDFAIAKSMDEKQMVEVAADPERTFRERYIAHWRMFGPKFPCTVHQNPKADTQYVLPEFYNQIGMPPLIRAIAHDGYKKSGEALGIPVPFLWQWMTCSLSASKGDDPFEDNRQTMSGGYLSATLDKHTWQGKGAMKRFLSQCKPIKLWLNQHCVGDHFSALERAIFYTEGALLRPRLGFEGSSQFYYSVLEAKLHSNGIKSLDAGIDFYKLVQANLDLLDELRK